MFYYTYIRALKQILNIRKYSFLDEKTGKKNKKKTFAELIFRFETLSPAVMK